MDLDFGGDFGKIPILRPYISCHVRKGTVTICTNNKDSDQLAYLCTLSKVQIWKIQKTLQRQPRMDDLWFNLLFLQSYQEMGGWLWMAVCNETLWLERLQAPAVLEPAMATSAGQHITYWVIRLLNGQKQLSIP